MLLPDGCDLGLKVKKINEIDKLIFKNLDDWCNCWWLKIKLKFWMKIVDWIVYKIKYDRDKNLKS